MEKTYRIVGCRDGKGFNIEEQRMVLGVFNGWGWRTMTNQDYWGNRYDLYFRTVEEAEQYVRNRVVKVITVKEE